MFASLISFGKKSLSRETKLQLHYGLIRVRYAFDRGHALHCPICGRQGARFAAFNGRPNVMCPRCFSLERHRLLYLFLSQRTEAFTRPMHILHFAPEKCLAVKLRQRQGAAYVTADNMTQFIPMIEVKPDRIMSLTDIQDREGVYDLVICSHVLEHVVEDRQAIREIYRVLKPGGMALVLVPINPGAETTMEDLTLSEAERRRQYGSPHHVRYYAEPDFMRRLAEPGFHVTGEDYASQVDAARFRLNKAEIIYQCRK